MSLISKIESMLFISSEALTPRKISKIIGGTEGEVVKMLQELSNFYIKENRGIALVNNFNKWQMVTSPKNSDLVKLILKEESSPDLSQPALEALTIIAYKSPISKAELEKIRGVNSSLIIRNLFIKGLIEIKKGKEISFEKTGSGSEILKEEVYYFPTTDFLKFLGISSQDELPDYDKLKKDEFWEKD